MCPSGDFGLQGPKELFSLSIQEFDLDSPKVFEEDIEEGEVDAKEDPSEDISPSVYYGTQAKASDHMLSTGSSFILEY